MKYKLKKIRNLTFIIFAFFFGFMSITSAKTGGIYPKYYSGIKYWQYKTSSGSYKTRTNNMGDMGVYYYANGSGRAHAYCIEPDERLSSGYEPNVTIALTGYSAGFMQDVGASAAKIKQNATKRSLLQYVLTFAYNYKTSVPSSASSVPKDVASKIFASQGLIWEIVTGERTTFASASPSNKNPNGNNFYTVIHGRSDTVLVKNEYDRIISAIQGSFYRNPGEDNTKKVFKVPGSENSVPLVWDSKSGKYSLTINDPNFKYWNVSNKGGLDVSKTDSSITISTTKSIASSSPASIEVSIASENGTNGATAYYYNGLQDLITVNGTTLQKYIKVYTPKYQLKITKVSTLDEKKLSGAKFQVCSDSACTKVLGTVTTGSDGTAVYTSLPNPGTYYVKETEAPKGYSLNSSPQKVTVSASNQEGTSSYGAITVKNSNNVFNLTKKTVDESGKVIDLNDGCGTDTYTGPEFEIKENGNSLYFKEIKSGEYELSSKDASGSTNKIKTCKGKFKVYTLPNCKYTISETKAPEGLTLPSEPTKSVNICGSDKNISFTNGFAGLEFQKKNEDGDLLSGGKYALQQKVNNVYKDMILKQNEIGSYEYDSNLKDNDTDATYILQTDGGIALISKLPPGEYRVVEKEAPEGYELIKDKNSTAKVTIKDSGDNSYYLVEMVDEKISLNGGESSAELIVAIMTGRKVINYVLVISGLVVLLIIAIFLRKKLKK